MVMTPSAKVEKPKIVDKISDVEIPYEKMTLSKLSEKSSNLEPIIPRKGKFWTQSSEKLIKTKVIEKNQNPRMVSDKIYQIDTVCYATLFSQSYLFI